VLALAVGCTLRAAPPEHRREPFRFPADAFAFANQTIWEYEIRPGAADVRWYEREPRPDFALRCGTMVRVARQFYDHARFDPRQAVADPATYERLVREVIRRDPRRPSGEPVVVPGYADFRRFSAAHEPLLKRAMAGPWQSYLQRGNWRMIFPFTGRQQQGVADELVAALAAGRPPIVHVLRYPKLTINHMLLVFAADETPADIRFHAYDPNDADHPVTLTYERAAHGFVFARTPYFPGGPVKAYEVYDGLLF